MTAIEDMEEWVAHPDKHVRVPVSQHAKQAAAPGWWCLADRPEKGDRPRSRDELTDDQ